MVRSMRQVSNLRKSMDGRQNTALDAMLKEHENIFVSYVNNKETIANDGRCIVDLNDLRLFDDSLPRKIIKDPAAFLEPFADGLRRLCNENGVDIPRNLDFNVGFDGAFGRNHITPRGLGSQKIGQLVMVEGIVTRMTVLRPRMEQSVSYEESQERIHIRSHPSWTRITKRAQLGTSIVPATSPDGNPMEAEFGLSVYKDTQRLTLQEVPERAPTGQLPCSVDVHLEHDLVDRCKPGDRIVIVGTFQANTFVQGGASNGIARQVLIAHSVKRLKEHITAPKITDEEMAAIKSFAQRDDTFEFLARSFAPSIYGHEQIKKGLLLMLLGGNEKKLSNGTHLRGDCHVMMVGDPSCGKSQLLRFVMGVAPLAISTTGRGTTGVGLTAAVTVDKDSNQRQLEAGAMVLADRGIVCIDEFDKMSVMDRVAIHEAMEQQTVTIAKAGVYAELHARCTVVAAANPKYGHIDDSVPLRAQLDFPDSLISRFDLVFVVRDLFDSRVDRRIAQFVLGRNKMLAAGESGTAISSMLANELTSVIEVDDSALRKEQMAVEKDRGVFVERIGTKANGEGGTEIAKLHFLRKYIYYAKHIHQAPTLSDAAVDAIAKIYTNLRERVKRTGNQSVTTRALEGLIRLSTAHAKLKLHSEVDVHDVQAAQALMMFCMLGKQSATSTTLNRDDDDDGFDPNDDDEDDDKYEVIYKNHWEFDQQEEDESEEEDMLGANAQADASTVQQRRRQRATISEADEDELEEEDNAKRQRRLDAASTAEDALNVLAEGIMQERKAQGADVYPLDLSPGSVASERCCSALLNLFGDNEVVPKSDAEAVIEATLGEILGRSATAAEVDDMMVALSDRDNIFVMDPSDPNIYKTIG